MLGALQPLPRRRVPKECFLAASGFWIAHNLQVGSRWGLTSDALAVSMLTVGLWRGRSARWRAQTGQRATGEVGATA